MVILILEYTVLSGAMCKFSVVTQRKKVAFNKLHLVTTLAHNGSVFRVRNQLLKVLVITVMEAAILSDILIVLSK